MTGADVMQIVNLGGVLAFAFMVYLSIEKLGKKIEAMTAAMGGLASRMDVASGLERGDPTPPQGSRPYSVRPPA